MTKQTYRQHLVQHHLLEGYPERANAVLEMSDATLLEAAWVKIQQLERRLKDVRSSETPSRWINHDMGQ